MNLKDVKVQVIFTEDSIPRVVNAELTFKGMTDLEKIQDDFAIRFAEWLLWQDITQRGKNNFVCKDGAQRSTKELLEIYKKESNEQ
jgi:hypothetical protein